MVDGITITINTDDFRRKVDNFLGHEFIEFIRNPGDAVMYEINKFLAELFEPYVPFDTGVLANSVEVTAEGISYNTDYAHYVYEGEVYGPNLQIVDKETGEIVWRSPKGKSKYPTGRLMTYTNPLATRHWDETAIANNRELVNQTVRDIIIEAWNNEH